MKIIKGLPRCPVCGEEMVVERLRCPTCGISVEGEFLTNPFTYLKDEEVNFLLVFLKARGNIKEVERILGISYPTVRNRLNNVLKSLGITPVEEEEEQRASVKEILEKLDRGEISPEKAKKLLKKGG